MFPPYPPATAAPSHNPHRFLIRNPKASWHDMDSFPKPAMQLLDAHFTRSTSKVLKTNLSDNSDSAKMLIELQDGMQVESVILLYDTTSMVGVVWLYMCQHPHPPHPPHPHLHSITRDGSDHWHTACNIVHQQSSGMSDGLHVLCDRNHGVERYVDVLWGICVDWHVCMSTASCV